MQKEIGARYLKNIFDETKTCEDYMKRYGVHLSDILSKVDSMEIARVVDIFVGARDRHSTIFFIGNGGSAATAAHFAQDIAEISRKTGAANFRAISLCDNAASLTAIGNDYGYETIFTGQLENLFKKSDVLVAISASGNSANIIKAVEYVKRMGGISVGLIGFDGGMLKKLCDHSILIETGKGEYGPVEDVHLAIDHMITSYIMWYDLASTANENKKNLL